MQKRVTIQLGIEAEWESVVYARLGDLLNEIEDGDFEVVNVKVEDVLPFQTFKESDFDVKGLSSVITRNPASH
jgi:hypothetical protein